MSKERVVLLIAWFGNSLSTFHPVSVHDGVTRVFEFDGIEFTFQIPNGVPYHLGIAYAFQYMQWYAYWKEKERR